MHTDSKLHTDSSGGFPLDIHADDGELIARANEVADAERIIACWNAFDGVPTGLVETMPGPVHDLAQAHAKAVEQRDNLLAALEGMIEEFRALDLPYGSSAYAKAIEVRNQVKGEQPVTEPKPANATDAPAENAKCWICEDTGEYKGEPCSMGCGT